MSSRVVSSIDTNMIGYVKDVYYRTVADSDDLSDKADRSEIRDLTKNLKAEVEERNDAVNVLKMQIHNLAKVTEGKADTKLVRSVLSERQINLLVNALQDTLTAQIFKIAEASEQGANRIQNEMVALQDMGNNLQNDLDKRLSPISGQLNGLLEKALHNKQYLEQTGQKLNQVAEQAHRTLAIYDQKLTATSQQHEELRQKYAIKMQELTRSAEHIQTLEHSASQLVDKLEQRQHEVERLQATVNRMEQTITAIEEELTTFKSHKLPDFFSWLFGKRQIWNA